MILTAVALNDRDQHTLAATHSLARRLGEPVMLVHVIAPVLRAADRSADRRVSAVDKLLALADRFTRDGIDVQPEVLEGEVVDAIHDCASRLRPRLVVVGGRDGETYHGTNHVAARLARCLPCPFLVTSTTGTLLERVDTTRRLRALVALDDSAASDTAIAELKELRALMPLDVDVVSIYWPPEEQKRRNLPRGALLAPDPVVEGLLIGELRARIGDLPGSGHVSIKALPMLGTLGLLIAAEAQERGADFIITGSHQRSRLGGMLHGSVTHQLLRDTTIPVLFAPLTGRGPRSQLGEPRRVLVATDLSDFGNRAIAYAYAHIRNTGGSVELLHVLTPASAAHLSGLMDRDLRLLSKPSELATSLLEGLIPPSAETYDLSSTIRIETGEDAARLITERAKAINADVICLAAHGAGKLRRSLGDSVTADVVQHTDRPVLLVR